MMQNLIIFTTFIALSVSVEWQWQENDGSWKPYHPKESDDIEKAYKSGSPWIRFDHLVIYLKDANGNYRSQFYQHSDTSGKDRNVQRIDTIYLYKLDWSSDDWQTKEQQGDFNQRTIADLIKASGWNVPEYPNKIQIDQQDVSEQTWISSIRSNDKPIQICLHETFYRIVFKTYQDQQWQHEDAAKSSQMMVEKTTTVTGLKEAIRSKGIDLSGYDAYNSMNKFGDSSTMQQMGIIPSESIAIPTIYFAPKATPVTTTIEFNKYNWDGVLESQTTLPSGNFNDKSIGQLIQIVGWQWPQQLDEVRLDGIAVTPTTLFKSKNPYESSTSLITIQSLHYQIRFQAYLDSQWKQPETSKGGEIMVTKMWPISLLKQNIKNYHGIDLDGYIIHNYQGTPYGNAVLRMVDIGATPATSTGTNVYFVREQPPSPPVHYKHYDPNAATAHDPHGNIIKMNLKAFEQAAGLYGCSEALVNIEIKSDEPAVGTGKCIGVAKTNQGYSLLVRDCNDQTGEVSLGYWISDSKQGHIKWPGHRIGEKQIYLCVKREASASLSLTIVFEVHGYCSWIEKNNVKSGGRTMFITQYDTNSEPKINEINGGVMMKIRETFDINFHYWDKHHRTGNVEITKEDKISDIKGRIYKQNPGIIKLGQFKGKNAKVRLRRKENQEFEWSSKDQITTVGTFMQHGITSDDGITFDK